LSLIGDLQTESGLFANAKSKLIKFQVLDFLFRLIKVQVIDLLYWQIKCDSNSIPTILGNDHKSQFLTKN